MCAARIIQATDRNEAGKKMVENKATRNKDYAWLNRRLWMNGKSVIVEKRC
jgi:hypothetical protein